MIGILVIALSILAFIVFALICHFNIDVTRYAIPSSKIQKYIKILQLSDLHSRIFGKDNDKLIKYIKEEKPDIIVCTGDMINAKIGDVKKLEKLMIELVKICNVYYIMGNREFRYNKEEYIDLVNMLKKRNVIVLENDKRLIENTNISIYGINYYNRKKEEYYEYIKDNMLVNEKINKVEEILPAIDKNKYNLLLVHSPNKFKEYASLGFDLVLAGHIHGGVIHIPFLGGLLSPEVRFFPKYAAGMFYESKSTMCVSRGLGYGSLPFRILNNPEIVVVTIQPK